MNQKKTWADNLLVGERIMSPASLEKATVVDADETHVLVEWDLWGQVGGGDILCYSRDTVAALFKREA